MSNEEKLDLLKQKVKDYRDYFGGKILEYDLIDFCSSEEELADLLKNHDNHIEDMCNYAHRSLARFKKAIGLNLL